MLEIFFIIINSLYNNFSRAPKLIRARTWRIQEMQFIFRFIVGGVIVSFFAALAECLGRKALLVFFALRLRLRLRRWG